MIVKNIDKREEINKKNKILLEKLIILWKKYKVLKKVNKIFETERIYKFMCKNCTQFAIQQELKNYL